MKEEIAKDDKLQKDDENLWMTEGGISSIFSREERAT